MPCSISAPVLFTPSGTFPVPSVRNVARSAFLPRAQCRRNNEAKLTRRNAARMSAVPDDTALDMLSFALSGPGMFASIAFLGGLGGLLFSFGEVGPRRRSRSGSPVLLLRVTTDAALDVEVLTGGTRTLREGENVLQFSTREACTAAARQLERAAERRGCALQYAVYSAGPSGMAELSRFPADLNANGRQWESVEVLGNVSDAERAMFEYERMGSTGDIDREWARVVDALSPIRFEQRLGDCKLCAGSGNRRCTRCGGASRPGGKFVCHCHSGRVVCEWCKGSGNAM